MNIYSKKTSSFILLLAFIRCLAVTHVQISNNASKGKIPQAQADTTISESDACPSPNSSVDARFPAGFPQNLTFGRFRDQSGAPYITQDCWADLVDNRRTFFLRPHEDGFPSIEKLRDWIRSRPHPISLVMNNQMAKSWPADLDADYELILNETKLHAVYVGNPRNLENYPKVKPLPVGLKWQYKSTKLFGEDKKLLLDMFSKVASTSEETAELFNLPNRTSTVWLRPMMNSNARTQNYLKNTDALSLPRSQIRGVLERTAPKSVAFLSEKLDILKYFDELKKHRFVVSPAGNGLDCHATWEALLAGCIPIVPRSALDPLFDELPVWLVERWDEVTDDSVKRKEEEIRGLSYNWEKVFTLGWRKEIHKGLCKIL